MTLTHVFYGELAATDRMKKCVKTGHGKLDATQLFKLRSAYPFIVSQPISTYFCYTKIISSMVQMTALNEIVDFIAKQSPENVVAFQASEDTKTRVYDLVYKEKTSSLTEEEKSELEYYKVLEHIMRLAKAKAYKLLHTLTATFPKTFVHL